MTKWVDSKVTPKMRFPRSKPSGTVYLHGDEPDEQVFSVWPALAEVEEEEEKEKMLWS